jgi:hypothetical protein
MTEQDGIAAVKQFVNGEGTPELADDALKFLRLNSNDSRFLKRLVRFSTPPKGCSNPT